MTARPSPIPAAGHAATAEAWPARLLRALAQNPEPLSAPTLGILLAEPGQRRRLLISRASALRRREKTGHAERAGRLPAKRSAAPSTRSAPSATLADTAGAVSSSCGRWATPEWVLKKRPGLDAPVLTRLMTVRPYGQPEPHGPDLLRAGYFRAAGALGEQREKLSQTRIRLGQMPFGFAKSPP